MGGEVVERSLRDYLGFIIGMGIEGDLLFWVVVIVGVMFVFVIVIVGIKHWFIVLQLVGIVEIGIIQDSLLSYWACLY